MSSTDAADIGQLAESERAALQTFTTVTGQDPAAAIPLLRRSQWNVQVGYFLYRVTTTCLRCSRSNVALKDCHFQIL